MCISDKSGAHIIPLCLKGKSNKIGIRSSARFWFSAVTLIMIFSHQSPQSDGKQESIRSGRLVSRKNFTSLRIRMISQACIRQASASSRKKSEVIHTRMSSPLLILYSPLRFFAKVFSYYLLSG